MADADAHCEGLVRTADHDRFLATLFAPAPLRSALHALYAFDIMVSRVPAMVTQPMAGEVRLQWWSEVIDGAREGEAAANPVARALRAAMAGAGLPAPPLHAVIEAGRAALYGEPDAPARADAAVVEAAAWILSGGRDPGIGALAAHLGEARALSGGDAAARALALRHLDDAAALLTAAPPAVLPALLPAALLRPRIEGREWPQWRRQWRLWRAARRPSRLLA